MSSRGDEPGDEGFLTRWSRRKTGIAREDAKPAPSLGPHPEEPPSGPALGRSKDKLRGVSKDVPDGSGANWSILRDATPDGMSPQDEGLERRSEDVGDAGQAPEMVEPPSLDLVDKDFDVAHWLKQNVPESWKLAALRRAWESDPAIAGFENPARDYALDWNTPGGAPGYGPLTESDDVEAMVRGIFGETPAPETEPETVAEATGDSMPHPLSLDDEGSPPHAAAQKIDLGEAPASSVRLTDDGADVPDHSEIAPNSTSQVYAAVQNNTASDVASVRVRKRGGGAIPH